MVEITSKGLLDKSINGQKLHFIIEKTMAVFNVEDMPTRQ